MDCSTVGFPVHHQLLELAQTHVHLVGDTIQLSHPLLSLSPPAFNLSQPQGLYQGVSSLHQVATVSELQLSISPPSEYSGLISFRTDWLDLFAVQATLKSLLQHHSSKASVLRHSAFFMVQLSHPNMTTGKTIALTGWTFVSKVMSLLFNTLSRFVIAFLPKEAVDGNVSSCALWYQIAWVQIPALPLISNVISGSELASSSLGFLIYDIHGKTVTFVHFQINDMMV